MTETTDLDRITRAQQHTWATGNLHICALSASPAGEKLIESVDPHSGQTVLDVGCGSGSTALYAARRYCKVTGLDYVPGLLERAKKRAEAELLEVDWVEADARSMPFPDASFDFVVSSFGVMFVADQEKMASELLRVCKPGGKIGMVNWMPDGVGDLVPIVSKYAPPPAQLKPVTRWGTEEGVRELLGSGAREIQFQRRRFGMYFRSIDHLMGLYKTQFGPTVRAFKFLNAKSREELEQDMIRFLTKFNKATDGTLILDSEYGEAIVTRAE
jgi:ubiquinone/menaquinone biosynthesis C-methylase UbiE